MKKLMRFGTLVFAFVLILQILSLSITSANDVSAGRAPLQTLVNQSLRHDGREYTNATWHIFIEALSGAQAVLADTYASEAQINTAYAKLQAAASSLVAIASFGNPFADISRGDWFYIAVMYVNANALMQGEAEATFSPDGTLSRAMAVTTLYRMSSGEKGSAGSQFTDVPADAWFTNAVLWAAYNGIIDGIGAGRFDPDGTISREQMATMLHRFARYKGYDLSLPVTVSLDAFYDFALVSDWAYEAVLWAVYNDLIRGSNRRLSPAGTASRAEYAVILQRFTERFGLPRQLPGEPPQQQRPDQHYIAWEFIAYLEPSLTAAKQERFAPQTVNLTLRRDDGWAQIVTEGGTRWVYLLENLRYVERAVYLYDKVGGNRGPRITPQIVSILAKDGDWYQITTWLGPKWIYLGTAPLPGGPLIALTFDDGPSTHTARLLDALYARNVSATFFVLGQQVTAYPKVAARIVNEGHEIASHTYRHPDLANMSSAAIRDELSLCRSAILRATGVDPTLLRPPYGSHSKAVQAVAAEFGYPLILWSVDTRDWESRNVDAILGHFVDGYGRVKIRDGDIILMHDIYSTTIDAAIRAIDILLAEGFNFVTVSELLTARHGTLTPGKVYNR